MSRQSVNTAKYHTVHLPQPNWGREELTKGIKFSGKAQQQPWAQGRRCRGKSVHSVPELTLDHTEHKQ